MTKTTAILVQRRHLLQALQYQKIDFVQDIIQYEANHAQRLAKLKQPVFYYSKVRVMSQNPSSVFICMILNICKC